MKYEIITDADDLLILVVNSRVIAISHRMSYILDKVEENYTAHRNKTKIAYDRAHIDTDDSEEKPIEKPIKKESKEDIFGILKQLK